MKHSMIYLFHVVIKLLIFYSLRLWNFTVGVIFISCHQPFVYESKNKQPNKVSDFVSQRIKVLLINYLVMIWAITDI